MAIRCLPALILGILLTIGVANGQVPVPDECHTLVAHFNAANANGNINTDEIAGSFPYHFDYEISHIGSTLLDDTATSIVSPFTVALQDEDTTLSGIVVYSIEYFSTSDCSGPLDATSRLIPVPDPPGSVGNYTDITGALFAGNLCGNMLSYQVTLSILPPAAQAAVSVVNPVTAAPCITYTLCCPEPVVPVPPPAPIPTSGPGPEPEEPEPEPEEPVPEPTPARPPRAPRSPLPDDDGRRFDAFTLSGFGIAIGFILLVVILAIIIMLIIRYARTGTVGYAYYPIAAQRAGYQSHR